MTPAETFQTIGAVRAAREREQKLALATAWHTAALMRSKHMPSLNRFLIGKKRARRLHGKELEQRKAEHDEMLSRLDVSRLNDIMRDRHGS
jgi:hypothetical protein